MENKEVQYANTGRVFGKNDKLFNIAALDENNMVLAWYKGYYKPATDTYTLYPETLTKDGKKQNYKMEKIQIKSSQIKK